VIAPSSETVAESEDVYLRRLRLSDSTALLELRRRNRLFFKPYEPRLSERHFTLEGQLDEISFLLAEQRADRRYAMGVFASGTDSLVGRVTLANVVRGAWQNATIGYYIDREQNSKGYATQAVRLTVRHAFEGLRLHRVQGAVIPSNGASARVLEKAGFRYEGLALHYLEIDGMWADHTIWAITREDWEGLGAG
jgi:ribosomal-protein-alanine N-acetyltransferase